jgi:hypothetical protein
MEILGSMSQSSGRFPASCRTFLAVVALSTLALASPVHIKSGADVAIVKIIQSGGSSTVFVDNQSTKDQVSSVKVTPPKGATASCDSCTKGTDAKGNVTLTWNAPIDKNEVTGRDFKTDQTSMDVTVTYDGHSLPPTNIKAQAPKKTASGQRVDKSDDHKSVVFDAAKGTLMIDNDVILPTPFPGDPLNGAAVVVPQYTLVGATSDPNFIEFEATFENQLFHVQQGTETLIRAGATFLFYDIAQNQFFAQLDLPQVSGAPPGTALSGALPDTGSQALAQLNSLLNPTGADFLPEDAPFAAVFVPDANFYTGTNQFTSSFDVGSTDYFLVTIPEPCTLVLVTTVLVGILLRRGMEQCLQGRLGCRGLREPIHMDRVEAHLDSFDAVYYSQLVPARPPGPGSPLANNQCIGPVLNLVESAWMAKRTRNRGSSTSSKKPETQTPANWATKFSLITATFNLMTALVKAWQENHVAITQFFHTLFRLNFICRRPEWSSRFFRELSEVA